MEEKKEQKMNFFKRWYTYQKERFPVVIYGLYIFSIVFAIFCYSNYIECVDKPNFILLIPMFVFAFLQFLMVRIVDEFKDYEDDSKYRPYRPVPRGLITLKELKVLFVICLLIQIALALVLNIQNLILLVLFWMFFFCFSKDFFIKKYLDEHILVTVLVDELLVALLGLYISTFVTGTINPMMTIILIMVYLVSWIVEVARKVRCKEDEEKGVNTYTAVLGIGKTIFVLFVTQTLLMLLQVSVLGMKHLPWILVLYTITDIINIVFAEKKTRKYAKLVELMANIFIVVTYLSMGLLLV